MKILVCGGRHYGKTDKEVSHMLSLITKMYETYAHVLEKKDLNVIHGNCRGADLLFEKYLVAYCKDYKHPLPKFKRYYPDWEEHGKAAGPIRNRQMLNENKNIDFAIVFKGGRGTADMTKILQKAGIKIITREKDFLLQNAK